MRASFHRWRTGRRRRATQVSLARALRSHHRVSASTCPCWPIHQPRGARYRIVSLDYPPSCPSAPPRHPGACPPPAPRTRRHWLRVDGGHPARAGLAGRVPRARPSQRKGQRTLRRGRAGAEHPHRQQRGQRPLVEALRPGRPLPRIQDGIRPDIDPRLFQLECDDSVNGPLVRRGGGSRGRIGLSDQGERAASLLAYSCV